MTDDQTPEDRFPYPRDTVVAVASDDTSVGQAVDRLSAAGMPDTLVDVLRGQDGAESIDPNGAEHGRSGRLKRLVQSFAGDETGDARNYAEQIRGGRQLVAVTVENREQALLAAGALRDAGLDEVRYYSALTVEAL